MTLLEWLDSEYIGGRVKDRFAELIAVNNGDLSISKVGYVKQGQGMYGRVGLSVVEAIEFAKLTGTLDGFLHASNESVHLKQAFKMKIQEVFDKKKANKDGNENVILATEADLKRQLEIENKKHECLKGMKDSEIVLERELRGK